MGVGGSSEVVVLVTCRVDDSARTATITKLSDNPRELYVRLVPSTNANIDSWPQDVWYDTRATFEDLEHALHKHAQEVVGKFNRQHPSPKIYGQIEVHRFLVRGIEVDDKNVTIASLIKDGETITADLHSSLNGCVCVVL